jgi:hypothetical protein
MILRRIGAVVLGLIIALVVNQISELGVHAIKPAPDIHSLEQVKAYVASLPLSALLLVLVGWLIGTFLGAWAAARIGRTPVTAYVLGAIQFCIGIWNAIVLPQPVWYSVALEIIYIVVPIIAARLAFPQPAAAPAPPPASI